MPFDGPTKNVKMVIRGGRRYSKFYLKTVKTSPVFVVDYKRFDQFILKSRST